MKRPGVVLEEPRPLLGPLPVQVFTDGDASRLVLRHEHGEIAFTVEDPARTLREVRPLLATVPLPAAPSIQEQLRAVAEAPQWPRSHLLEVMREQIGAPA